MTNTAFKRKQKHVTDEDDTNPRALFACAKCGTLASTNSAKCYTDDQVIDLDQYDDLDQGQANEDLSVRMSPACPCGCDLFNFEFVQRPWVEIHD